MDESNGVARGKRKKKRENNNAANKRQIDEMKDSVHQGLKNHTEKSAAHL